MNQKKLLSKPIAYVFFILTGFLFLFCCLTGRDLAEQGNIVWTLPYTVRTLAISLAAGGIAGSAVCFGFYRAASYEKIVKVGGEKGRNKLLAWLWDRQAGITGAWKIFFCSLGLTLIVWFPVFMAYYPAICAYDSPVQTEQIVYHIYIDHHPIAHTLMIKWAMMLGENVFGNINTGIGCYTLLQMIFLASAFAFGMCFLWRRRVRHIWLVVTQLFCMLYPFHLYMSVSMTKDTIFSSFFIIQLLALCEIFDKQVFSIRKYELVFFVSTIGMILFRNNGKYAYLFFLVCVLFSIVFGRKNRPFRCKLFLWSLGAFAAGVIMLSVIYRAVDGNQGDKREMLSIPIQQLARVMIYHGGVGVMPEDDNTMAEEDKALINDFILYEAYRNYRPDFADPVKSNTNTYVARYRMKEFLSAYFRLFAQYPGDYLNAALAVNAGYLYVFDVSHAVVNSQEGQADGGGYIQTRWEEDTLNARGIYKDPKWLWLFEAMEKWANENAYLNIPVLKYLFVPGVWIWLYLLLLGWWLIQRKFGGCLLLSLVFGYYLTLLLGPTVQLRYIYPIMIAFPFILFYKPWSSKIS